MRWFTKYTGQGKMNKIKFLLMFLILAIGINSSFASVSWTNNLRTMFLNNAAIIYTLNVRTFGAKDYNKNDIIETELGEVKGTFINAIPKLKPLAKSGVNTIYLLPVTKVGKLKALGTAGSLYAIDSFDTINPQLFDETDFNPDIKAQAKKFIDEAHKLGMHVIIDLPSCGSYDMSLEKPELFIKDKDGNAVIPADWTDVRLFKVYDGNKELNKALIGEYKKFIDLVQYIGADGIRADVAAIKPYEFWKIIIDYARDKDPSFFFLAEASSKWTNPAKGYTPYASVEELLNAGFDGFYSDWSNLKEIKTNKDLYAKMDNDLKIINKFDGQKSVIANFATHDQTSPALLGYEYWQMVNWLNFTLPLNPYVLDGFPSADSYMYKFQNKKADKSYTDDDTYFVHKGKMDIFNFSRAPLDLDSPSFVREYSEAVRLRYMMAPLITTKDFVPLKTNNPSVFGFKKQNGGDSIIIIGNLDYTASQKAKVKVPKLDKDDFVMPFKMVEPPVAKNGSFSVALRPYEIQVLAVKKTLNTK